MAHTACTELQCLYKGALYLPLPCLSVFVFLLSVRLFVPSFARNNCFSTKWISWKIGLWIFTKICRPNSIFVKIIQKNERQFAWRRTLVRDNVSLNYFWVENIFVLKLLRLSKHLDSVCRDCREILYLPFLTKIFLAFVKTSRLCLQGLAWNFIFTIFDKIFLAFVKTSRLCLEGLAWNFIFTIFDKNFFDTFRFCLKYGKHKTLYLNAYVDFNIWPILDFIILAVFCAVRTEVQETVF